MGLRQASFEGGRLLGVQSVVGASVSAIIVDDDVIVAVDLSVLVAVLLVLGHVVLDGASSAQWLVHAVLKGSGIVGMIALLHGLLGIDPVWAGDAEQTANITRASHSLVAVAHGLTDAAQTNVGDGGGIGWNWCRGLILLDTELLLLCLQLLGCQLELGRVE